MINLAMSEYVTALRRSSSGANKSAEHPSTAPGKSGRATTILVQTQFIPDCLLIALESCQSLGQV